MPVTDPSTWKQSLATAIPLQPQCEVEPPNWSSVHPSMPPSASEEHLVTDGENWVNIANSPKFVDRVSKYRESGLPASVAAEIQGYSDDWANAKALVFFNYGTIVPKHVNWYLRYVNCCYDATEDRCNRRFRSFDRDQRSERYGMIKRAGRVYIPTTPKPPAPEPDLPVARGIKLWAHVAYQDGLVGMLQGLAKACGWGGKTDLALNFLEWVLKDKGIVWTPAQLRQLALIRRFARPLRKLLKITKYAGWAGIAADVLLGRTFTGYLVMSFREPHDTHYAWELDMTLRGMGVFGNDSGEFSTESDPYVINTRVFDPTIQWKSERDLTGYFGNSKLTLTVHRAFRRNPVAHDYEDRAFAGDRYVVGSPGPLDWTFTLPSLVPVPGWGGYRSIYGIQTSLSNGRYRTFTEIASPLT